ncbi:MAG: type VI secretion system ImpA family N-terminal domain-containing protein, partial [Planctomycetes bacterium]|nr:type VI secretion system ImpA family N-terminal domain-containing protein [Planctomycetota bacterium]
MVDLARIDEIASTAIPGDAPAGINARYEEAYEELSLELAKLETLADERPDWSRVAEFAVTVLSDSSKDMNVCAWMAG